MSAATCRVRLILLPIILPGLLLAFSQAAVAGGSVKISLASVASNGDQANGDSRFPHISGNGRWVVFDSTATNLVPNDTNGFSDVFVHDMQVGTTTRVSVRSDLTQGNLSSSCPCSISANGQYVAFRSEASNLVPMDTNFCGWYNCADIFVHDRDTDGNGIYDEWGGVKTIRVSVSSNGTQGDRSSGNPSISADGRFVVFTSDSSNLAVGYPEGGTFVHDRDADDDGIFDEVGAISTTAIWGRGASYVSADRRYIGYSRLGTSHSDAYVFDRLMDQEVLVSVALGGAQANGDSGVESISVDGRFVAFSSWATNLVENDNNYPCGLQPYNCRDVFVRDRDTDGDGIFDEPEASMTTMVSVSSSGVPENSNARNARMSDDGRYVVWETEASNLGYGDTNGSADIFIRDRQTMTTKWVSKPLSAATLPQSSEWPALSGDGRYIAFMSAANNLGPNDCINCVDIFVYDSNEFAFLPLVLR